MTNARGRNGRGNHRHTSRARDARQPTAVVQGLEPRQLFAAAPVFGAEEYAIDPGVVGPAIGGDVVAGASTPGYGFALGRGSTGADHANAVAYDSTGNVYVGGSFAGTVDFDPVGTLELDAANGPGFLAKYTPAGTLLWARNVGGAVNDLAVDGSGNVVATGGFEGTKDFNPNAGVANLTSAGAQDVFVVRLSSNGNYSWARRVGGGAGLSDVGNGVAVDAIGRAYVTGYFQGTVDFDPGAGVSNLSAQALTDAFVLRLTTAGNFSFAKAIRGNGSERGNGIAIDPAGNVYTVGRFDKTADFDPSGGTHALAADDSLGGNYDAYLSKLNSSGNFLWAKRIGGGLWDEATDVAVGPDGSAHVTGRFTYEANFNPVHNPEIETPTTLAATGASGSDAFVARFRGDGALSWARKMGSDQTDEEGLGIDVDNAGNVYTTGRFRGTADFNPLGGTVNHTSAGGHDAFLSKLNSAGEHVYARRFGGTGTDAGRAVAVDGVRGNVFAVGSFENTVDFDPGAGTQNETSDGASDAYILKLTQPATPLAFALGFGGFGDDEGRKVVTDASGNVYVAGRIRGFTTLDPQAVASGFNSGSYYDVYVAKYTKDGAHVWSHRAHARQVDEDVGGIAVDAAGNVIVAGTFDTDTIAPTDTRLSFPDGTILESNAHTKDGFLWKLNSSGDTVWAKQFGQSGEENVRAMTLDGAGNIFVAGQFNWRLSYGPSINDEVESEGGQDVYFAKFNSSGVMQFARSIGGTGDEDAGDIAVDASGRIYVAGSFKSATVDLNPTSVGVNNRVRSGTESAFVLRATSGGGNEWGQAFGGTGATAFTSLALHPASGDVIVGGRFTGTLSATGGLAALASGGGTDALVVRLAGATGAATWGRRAGAAGEDQVNDLAIDSGGDVHAAGFFANTVDFDPGAGSASHASAGGRDAFHWSLTGAGNYVTARKFGGAGTDTGHGVAIGPGDQVLLTGSFADVADFAPGGETAKLVSGGGANIFLVKLVD